MGSLGQPRDDRGRFATIPGKPPTPASSRPTARIPQPSPSELTDPVAAAYSRFQEAQASVPAPVTDPDLQALLHDWSLIVDRSDGNVAAQLTRAINVQGVKAPTLYRGMPATGLWQLHLEDLQPGDALSLPVSSFSEHRDVAEQFMLGPDGDEEAYTAMIVLENGTGLPLRDLSEFPEQAEWLTCGEFRVHHVDSDWDRDIDYLITVRPSLSGRKLVPEPHERLVQARHGESLVSTRELTDETRWAYREGQCFALATVLAEQHGTDVGVLISGSDIPWGTRFDDPAYDLAGRRDWFDGAFHAVALTGDDSNGTAWDIDGRQDMATWREGGNNFSRAGSMIRIPTSELRRILSNTRGTPFFPQDYDTAELVSKLVPLDRSVQPG